MVNGSVQAGRSIEGDRINRDSPAPPGHLRINLSPPVGRDLAVASGGSGTDGIGDRLLRNFSTGYSFEPPFPPIVEAGPVATLVPLAVPETLPRKTAGLFKCRTSSVDSSLIVATFLKTLDFCPQYFSVSGMMYRPLDLRDPSSVSMTSSRGRTSTHSPGLMFGGSISGAGLAPVTAGRTPGESHLPHQFVDGGRLCP